MPKVDKKNKKDNEEKDFVHAVISCEKPIYRNFRSNHWKYWIFNIEIFTYLINEVI